MTLALGGETPSVIQDSGLRSGNGGSQSRAIAASDSAPRKVTLNHYDPARDYQAGLQQAVRPGAGHRVNAIELPAALSAVQAKQLAELALARADTERERRTVTTDWRALAIAPGRRVRIAGEPGDWRVTEWSLEGMALVFDLVRIAPASLPSKATGGRVLGARDVLAGQTILHAFELPHLGEDLPSAARISIAACGTQPGWRGAALAVSVDDGARWESAGETALPAIIGIVEAPAEMADCAIEDRRNMLVVELVHGGMQLADADAAALDRGENLALVGDELLQFGRAEPIGGNRWRLTRLWRGRRGTEAEVGRGRSGDRFVLIDAETLFQRDLPVSGGAHVRVMATAVNDVTGVEATAIRTNLSVTPPSPVALRARMNADHGVTLSWIRRSRSGWNWIDGGDVPLGEESERYQLRISSEGALRHEVTCQAAVFTLPASLRANGAVTVEVRQAGDHGLSPPAIITIAAED